MNKMNLYTAEKIKREYNAKQEYNAPLAGAEPHSTRDRLRRAHFYELLILSIGLLRQKAEMGKSTEECRKDCDIAEQRRKLDSQNADLVAEIAKLKAENEKLTGVIRKFIGKALKEAKALNEIIAEALSGEMIAK